MPTAQDLVGTWALERHGFFDGVTGAFTPTGVSPTGRLLYGADGAMAVLITKQTQAGSLADLIAYAGRFTVQGDSVLHHIEIAPDPARRGTSELRFATLVDDVLVLRTARKPEGYFEITWRRVS